MYNKLDTLVRESQQIFLMELWDKVTEIEKLLKAYDEINKKDKAQELLRFFHSMNGTASTIGLQEFASIGRKWEAKLKKTLEQDRTLDDNVIKDIYSEVLKIKDKLNGLDDNKMLKINSETENSYLSIHSRGKVLLIDDDFAILKLLENALTNEGYTVYICDDSVLAFDIITAVKPDIILLDVLMPELSGYELLKKIRKEPKYSNIQIFFLSAIDNAEDRIKGMRLGADDYITKPFIIDEVLARIEAALRRANKYKEKFLRDEFTGAYSRHYFNYRIIEEFEKYKRTGKTFSMAFLDIDYFRLINEKYGYRIGDTVLKELVIYLNNNIRKYDALFRYGGEEFILFLPDTEMSIAYPIIDRLRKGFEEKNICIDDKVIKITFSAGIVQVDEVFSDTEQLVEYANRTMHRAKRHGRNKVAVFDRKMTIKDFSS